MNNNTPTPMATPEEVVAKLRSTAEPFRVQAMRFIAFLGLVIAGIGSAENNELIKILPEEWGRWMLTIGLFAAASKQIVLTLGDLLDNWKLDKSFKFATLLLVFATLGCLLLPSCLPGVSMTSDGCLLGSYTKDGQTYRAGPCVGNSVSDNGSAEVDRFRVEWNNDEGQRLRATYWVKKEKPALIEYQLNTGLWLRLDAKSGISIGPIPPEVEAALQGDPQPVSAPNIIQLPEA